LGTYDRNATFYTTTEIDNSWRSWFWIVCNEVGYLQDGPPAGYPAIVTRIQKVSNDARQCKWFFPGAFDKVPPFAKVEATNAKYKGWNVKLNRLFVANGLRDPWKDATLSAETISVPSTPSMPIAVSDGFHCSDLSYANALIDTSVDVVQKQYLAKVKTWMTEWKPSKVHHKRVVLDEALVRPIEARDAATAPYTKPINAFAKSFGEIL